MNDTIKEKGMQEAGEEQTQRVAAGGVRWEPLAERLWNDYLQAHQEAVAEILSQVGDPLQRVEALSKLSLALDRTFRALDRGGGNSPLPLVGRPSGFGAAGGVYPTPFSRPSAGLFGYSGTLWSRLAERCLMAQPRHALKKMASSGKPCYNPRAAPVRGRFSTERTCLGSTSMPLSTHKKAEITLYGPEPTKQPVFLWSDALRTGHDAIDRQHQAMYTTFQGVSSLLEMPEIPVSYWLSMALRATEEYVLTHFADEEQLMAESHYPAWQQHKQLHRQIVEDLQHHHATIKRLTTHEEKHAEAQSLLHFLSAWLNQHILEEDVKLVAFLKGQ
ncbi:MAG: hemerythrin family protein [Magnetococcales bacterium]|nr:hemerythrin family protein [Magnetococcales bacterium]